MVVRVCNLVTLSLKSFHDVERTTEGLEVNHDSSLLSRLLAVRLLHSSSYQILMPCRYLKRREGTHSQNHSHDHSSRVGSFLS